MSNKKVIIILFTIVILGFGLRAYKLGAPVFVTDEFLDINATYGYHKTGQWVAWDFNLDRVSDNLFAPRDERAWPYRWQVAQLFRWFPPTEAVARSISVAWGVISIILIYFVGKYFTGKKEIGLLASFLFSVSMLGISVDRTLRMYAMFLPIFLLFAWFLLRFFEEEYRGNISILKKTYDHTGLNMCWLLPAIVTGIISYYVQVLTVNIGIAFFTYLFINAIISFRTKHVLFNKYSLSLTALFLGAAFFMFFFPSEVSWYSGAIKFFRFNSRYLSAIVSDYSNYILAYGLIMLGTYFILKKSKNYRRALWLACLFFGILSPAYLVWNYVVGERLIFFILPFGIILLASGIFYLAQFLSENSLRFKKSIFISVIAIALITLPSYSYFFEKVTIYKESRENPNYRKIFGYIIANSKPNDILFTRNFRSFYYQKASLKVYNQGASDEKISLPTLTEIMSENNHLWIPLGDDDGGSFSRDALNMIKVNFKIKERIGDINIYNWEK